MYFIKVDVISVGYCFFWANYFMKILRLSWIVTNLSHWDGGDVQVKLLAFSAKPPTTE
jgi:hypothetical protein